MASDKTINGKWNGDNFEDSDSGLRHARKYNPANPAQCETVAPDAEALAVALDSLQYAIDTITGADKKRFGAIRENARAVLLAYRAAHPVTR